MTANLKDLPFDGSRKGSIVTTTCSSYLASYSVPSVSVSNRIVVSCYETLTGTKKCTLSANATDDVLESLQFASEDDQFLIGCSQKEKRKAYLWDLNRGVLFHKLEYGNESEPQKLLDVASSSHHSRIFCLVKTTQRLIVHEYDLTDETPKIKKKIKITALDDEDAGNDAERAIPCAIAVSSSQETLAILYANRLFVVNALTGKRMHKIKVKNADNLNHHNETSRAMFSDDDQLVGITKNGDGDNGDLVIFRVNDGDCVGTVNINRYDPKFCIRYLNDHTYCVLNTNRVNNTAALHKIESNEKKKQGKVKSPDVTMVVPSSVALLDTRFKSGNTVRVMTWSLKNMQSGGGNVITIDQPFISESNEWYSGDIQLDVKEESFKESIEKSESAEKKKRKATVVSNKAITLGPGETGGEAMLIEDKQQKTKRVRKEEDGSENDDDDDDDDDDFDWEQTGDNEETRTTIAERLQRLTADMHRDSEDEEDDDDTKKSSEGTSSKISFKPKSATSDSLSNLLQQALKSNDDPKLEIALEVRDRSIIRNSIMNLSSIDHENGSPKDNIIIILLSKLVTRLAKKPTRADQLSFWIRTVLVALVTPKEPSKNGKQGWKMNKTEREIALKALEPLRNLLSERAENLSGLLKLEGRLSLLMQDH